MKHFVRPKSSGDDRPVIVRAWRQLQTEEEGAFGQSKDELWKRVACFGCKVDCDDPIFGQSFSLHLQTSLDAPQWGMLVRVTTSNEEARFLPTSTLEQ